MNEKIKELAEQADPASWHKRWYSGINPRVMDPETKRFVELIVEEATDLVRNMLDQNTAGEVIVEIKQHFGVL